MAWFARPVSLPTFLYFLPRAYSKASVTLEPRVSPPCDQFHALDFLSRGWDSTCPERDPAGQGLGLRPWRSQRSQSQERTDFLKKYIFLPFTELTSYFTVSCHSLGLDNCVYSCSGPETCGHKQLSQGSVIEGVKTRSDRGFAADQCWQMYTSYLTSLNLIFFICVVEIE